MFCSFSFLQIAARCNPAKEHLFPQLFDRRYRAKREVILAETLWFCHTLPCLLGFFATSGNNSPKRGLSESSSRGTHSRCRRAARAVESDEWLIRQRLRLHHCSQAAVFGRCRSYEANYPAEGTNKLRDGVLASEPDRAKTVSGSRCAGIHNCGGMVSPPVRRKGVASVR
jgi:hypothetical protein